MNKLLYIFLGLSLAGISVFIGCSPVTTTVKVTNAVPVTLTTTQPATFTQPGSFTTVTVNPMPSTVTVTAVPTGAVTGTLPVTTPPATTVYPPFTSVYSYYGPGGMMGPGGWMGPGMMGSGMTGGQWWQYGGERIGMGGALKVVQDYLASRGDANLEIDEEMEFAYNYYFEISEKDTSIGAFEVLVDPYNGSIYPEPGPNMMWNTKYGMMSGIIWGIDSAASPMTISEAQAATLARQFLDSYQFGSTAGGTSRFYGYYTLDTVKDGKVFGMLSVNGYTGQVWYHTWHGQFISEMEF